MSILVLLGICRKVKLSYLIVGHTHEDVDAVIGNVVSRLRREDLPTFERFREECMAAIKKEGGAVLDVIRIVGISDFDSVSTMFNTENVQGISSAKVIRITAEKDGSRVNIFYKPDATKPGWFPRPLPPHDVHARHTVSVLAYAYYIYNI